MDKITNFEWYNDQSLVKKFDKEDFLRNGLSFEENFWYTSSIEDFKKHTVGIRWEDCDKGKHTVTNIKIALPCPTMDKILVVPEEKIGEFNYNCFLFNADGSLYKEVIVPDRVPHFKSRRGWDSPTFVRQIRWVEDANDDFSMELELCGIYDGCYEFRLFNPQTAEFGECTNYGEY